MKFFNVKTAIAAVCVVAAGFGGVKAYNVANQSEADLLLAENVEALSSGDVLQPVKTGKSTSKEKEKEKEKRYQYIHIGICDEDGNVVCWDGGSKEKDGAKHTSPHESHTCTDCDGSNL